MNRQTWITVIGVLLIIFGGLGLLGNIQRMFMPKMIEFQQGMMDNAKHEAELNNVGSSAMIEDMQEMMNFPDWYQTAVVIMGAVGLLVMVLYLYSGIIMLSLKNNALKLARYALIGSLALAVVRIILGTQLNSFMAMSLIGGGIFSGIIDLVLLFVIIGHSDKYPYPAQIIEGQPQT